MLVPDDRALEKWEEAEAKKTAKTITKQYAEVAQEIAKLLKELFADLKSYNKPPAVLDMTPQSLKDWRAAHRKERIRNSEGVRRSRARLAAVAAFAAPLVDSLCREVWQKNAWHNAYYAAESWTTGFFADYSKPDAYTDLFQQGFSLLLDGVHSLVDYGKRLADLIGRTARKVVNVLHGAAKRAQNWARMQWIRMANLFDRSKWGKQWVTQHDDRVRDSHDPMDGQIRRPEELFVTGAGNHLLYPGDTTAPISEWINCRCNLRRVRMA